MTNVLIPVDESVDPQVLEALKDAEDSNYLPYFRLVSSNSAIAKKKPADGRINGGNYMVGVAGDDPVDLTDTVDVIVISARPCAVDMMAEPILKSYDRSSPEYINISTRAGGKDSGCAYGPEVLLWLGDKQIFAVWHLNSKSARMFSPKLIASIGKAVTLGSKVATSNDFTFEVPTLTALSDFHYASPTEEGLAGVREIFRNPPAQAAIEQAETVAHSEGR